MDWVTGGCEHVEIREPASQTIPFVFNSPHSGRCYTHAFLSESRLDSLAIRRSADHYVDDLFAAAPELGAPFLIANFPRAYLAVNRAHSELDPKMFYGPLPAYDNTHALL